MLEESELQDTQKAAMILGQAAIVVLVSDVASREVSRTDELRIPSGPYQLHVYICSYIYIYTYSCVYLYLHIYIYIIHISYMI